MPLESEVVYYLLTWTLVIVEWHGIIKMGVDIAGITGRSIIKNQYRLLHIIYIDDTME